jgi:enoyl-[acyl-carrier protein] reductase II
MTPEVLRQHIRKLKKASTKPFGVNLPLLYKHMPECIDVVLEEDVPIIFSSAGSPKKVAERLRQAGRIHVHVVASVRQAQKCADLGLDAVVCEGVEAGGHNAPQGTTSLCLIPQIADAVTIPVIAAGGIADGRGIAAALSLGASGVQIGTRFAVTRESSAHAAYKAAVIAADDRATVLALSPVTPVRLIKNDFAERVLNAEAKGADQDTLRSMLGRGRGKAAIFCGDLEEGEIEAGQIAGLINDGPAAAKVLADMVDGYQKAVQNLPQTLH